MEPITYIFSRLKRRGYRRWWECVGDHLQRELPWVHICGKTGHEQEQNQCFWQAERRYQPDQDQYPWNWWRQPQAFTDDEGFERHLLIS